MYAFTFENPTTTAAAVQSIARGGKLRLRLRAAQPQRAGRQPGQQHPASPPKAYRGRCGQPPGRIVQGQEQAGDGHQHAGHGQVAQQGPGQVRSGSNVAGAHAHSRVWN